MRIRDAALTLVKVGVLPYGMLTRDRRPGVTVLVYHRVGGGSTRQLDLSTELFDWQMRHLRQQCRVVSLDEVSPQMDAGGRRDLVVITFDDGYEDVYRHAFPVLSRYELPATLYLTTASIGSPGPFPFERSLPAPEQGRPLTWAQVRDMARSGLLTVGAHTHTHPDMTTLTAAQAAREIEVSNRIIAERLGQVPVHFAYPWGGTSPAVKAAVDRAYRTAAIGGTRKNAFGVIDLHALMRVPVQRSDGRLFFRLKLGSYLHGEEWARGYADSRRRGRTHLPVGARGSP